MRRRWRRRRPRRRRRPAAARPRRRRLRRACRSGAASLLCGLVDGLPGDLCAARAWGRAAERHAQCSCGGKVSGVRRRRCRVVLQSEIGFEGLMLHTVHASCCRRWRPQRRPRAARAQPAPLPTRRRKAKRCRRRTRRAWRCRTSRPPTSRPPTSRLPTRRRWRPCSWLSLRSRRRARDPRRRHGGEY